MFEFGRVWKRDEEVIEWFRNDWQRNRADKEVFGNTKPKQPSFFVQSAESYTERIEMLWRFTCSPASTSFRWFAFRSEIIVHASWSGLYSQSFIICLRLKKYIYWIVVTLIKSSIRVKNDERLIWVLEDKGAIWNQSKKNVRYWEIKIRRVNAFKLIELTVRRRKIKIIKAKILKYIKEMGVNEQWLLNKTN